MYDMKAAPFQVPVPTHKVLVLLRAASLNGSGWEQGKGFRGLRAGPASPHLPLGLKQTWSAPAGLAGQAAWVSDGGLGQAGSCQESGSRERGGTCEGFGLNRDPLEGLPTFNCQQQVDLLGAVGLGPVWGAGSGQGISSAGGQGQSCAAGLPGPRQQHLSSFISIMDLGEGRAPMGAAFPCLAQLWGVLSSRGS